MKSLTTKFQGRRRWSLWWPRIFTFLFALETIAAPGDTTISRQDRLELNEFYTNMLREKLRSELRLRGITDAEPSVSLTLEFDDERVAADSEAWKQAYSSQTDNQRQTQDQSFRTNISEMIRNFNDEQSKREEAARKAYEEQVKKLYDEYAKKLNDDHAKRLSEQEAKKLAEEEAKKQQAAAAAAGAGALPGALTGPGAKEGVRLGRLNVDITNATISEIIAKAQESQQAAKPAVETSATGSQQSIVINNTPLPTPPAMPPPPTHAPVTLSINVPTAPAATEPAFVYKAADYITKINVEITLPAKAPKEFADSLPQLVGSFLEFASIAGDEPTTDWVKVTTAPPIPPPAPAEPPAPATPKDFLQSIWKPDNAFLSTVVSGLILGLFVFLAMVIASRALSSGIQRAITGLGKDIASLKPPEEAKEGGDDAAAEETAVANAGEEESEQRGSFDQAAAGQALTREMQNIRSQMTDLIAENTFLCAEYLSDMFYDDNGLADFRDLLSFMGYTPLKPSLEQLPRAAVQRLEAYVEEHRETPPNILNGAEIAQRMYGECISKATLRDESMKAFDPVRAILIKSDDAIISKFIADADAVSVAVLLKTLTVERGNRLMKAIPLAVLKEAAGLLDKPIESPDQVIAGIITKIEQVASAVTERAQAQRRLIMRLVKSVSTADEGMVYDLVPPEDWDLKRQIMQTKLFMKDIIYVPGKIIGQAFGSLSLGRRAEIMLLADDALKSAIQATIQAGTKKAEMLQTEIDETQKNAKKMAEITARKDAVMEGLISAVRRLVGTDRMIIDQIIMTQAKALGLPPPEGLTATQDEKKAS